MRFARTRDLALVRAVLADSTQYRMAADDATPEAEAFEPNADERIVYVRAAGSAGELLGIFTLIPQNAVCFEIHAALLPAAWGRDRSRPALRGAVQFAWRETPAQRIVASIPAYNRLALKLARESGFLAFGRNPRAFLRSGALHDLVLMGVTRPD